jgi:hypothetical protein
MDRLLKGCILVPLVMAGCHAGVSPARPAISPNAARIECVNPDNGFAWTLRLSQAAGTVDGWPARFGAERISWRDGANSGYELELANGALTIVRASSTGGYMSFDRCAASPSAVSGVEREASP